MIVHTALLLPIDKLGHSVLFFKKNHYIAFAHFLLPQFVFLKGEPGKSTGWLIPLITFQ